MVDTLVESASNVEFHQKNMFAFNKSNMLIDDISSRPASAMLSVMSCSSSVGQRCCSVLNLLTNRPQDDTE
ncbi:hypothetical protein E2C01_004883 [Portunus trituberculatus]|uniref:Uncharacterized protein n=1 Tax=Portunus trituberculatus TaxID=210409 RepID=A0A5B7CSJ0_PORTR|nr:hypothetical protein [Portunus trituberculatus]